MASNSTTIELIKDNFGSRFQQIEFFKKGNSNLYLESIDGDSGLKQVLMVARTYAKESNLKKVFALIKELNHPNIEVPYFGTSLKQHRYILHFNYREMNFEEFLLSDPTEEELLNTFHDISKGLTYLASKKIVHCYICPKNILVSNGRATITNFSQAGKGKTLEDAKDGCQQYQSPEVIREKKLDSSTDIWSLGAMMAEVKAVNAFQYLKSVVYLKDVESNKVTLNILDSGSNLKFLMSRMLRFSPDLRPSAQGVAEVLRETLDTLATTVPSVSSEDSFHSFLSDSDVQN